MSTVQSIVDGTFTGDIQIGTLETGKVGLAPFHKFDSLISIEVKADLGKSSKISLLGKSRPSRKTNPFTPPLEHIANSAAQRLTKI